MNKEQKVISLSLAQKISKVAKEKGIELPESYFGWYQKYNEVWEIGDMEEAMNHAKMIGEATAPQWEYFKAFDTSELGEMLIKTRIEYRKELRGLWNCPSLEKIFNPNFLGKMYLYLLENDLIK